MALLNGSENINALTGAPLYNYLEQVSYIPVLRGSTTAGTTTYSQQVGHYTQIGKRVFVDALIQYTAVNFPMAKAKGFSLPRLAARFTRLTPLVSFGLFPTERIY